MQRWDIINHLIEKNGYTSYLEIGYYKGWSFDQVNCEQKTAMDPNPCKEEWWSEMPYMTTLGGIWKCTSDDGFRIAAGERWDIIFIDGLHESKQVERDIMNSLDHLSPGGAIVLHDCNPPTEQHTTTGVDGCWTGDVYKAFINFKSENEGYDAYVIDTDWGCGVIQKMKPGQKRVLTLPNLQKRAMENWDDFDDYREIVLNLISVEQFKTKIDERIEHNYLSAQ